MGFSQPAEGGNWFSPKDHNGHLVLVTQVLGIDDHFDKLKNKDVKRARFLVVDLDDPNWGSKPVEMLNSHPGIVFRLTDAAGTGEMVLGRIGQVDTGQINPAWSLVKYNPGTDDVRAQRWVDANLGDVADEAEFGVTAAPMPASGIDPATQALLDQLGTRVA